MRGCPREGVPSEEMSARRCSRRVEKVSTASPEEMYATGCSRRQALLPAPQAGRDGGGRQWQRQPQDQPRPPGKLTNCPRNVCALEMDTVRSARCSCTASSAARRDTGGASGSTAPSRRQAAAEAASCACGRPQARPQQRGQRPRPRAASARPTRSSSRPRYSPAPRTAATIRRAR